MTFFLPFICLLCVSRNIFGKTLEGLTDRGDDISYQDLKDMDVSCFPEDSCIEYRKDDPPYISYKYSCSCNEECWKFGACCIDSPHRMNSPPVQECRSTGDDVNPTGYYMVHRCPDNTDADSIWKYLCKKEWNEEDDILMLSPISSLETSITYKNYYCFRCHETTDEYISWNLLLLTKYRFSKERFDNNDSNFTLMYNTAKRMWVANEMESNVSSPVKLKFEIPYEMLSSAIPCNPEVISDCPETWTDKDVLHKCLAYAAIIHADVSYKNAHCALCNGEELYGFNCEKSLYEYDIIDTFSFRSLINISGPDRDRVGNTEKCEDDHLWDPYRKRCSKISCAIPEYVVKNKRCVLP